MEQNYTLEEQYEMFEGDLRRLEELIGQLEFWSDECTINHKKEDVRLPEYIELNNNLEALKEQLQKFLEDHMNDEGMKDQVKAYRDAINQKLRDYQVTKEHIHNWVREIKNIYTLVMKSDVLKENKAYIDEIINS